MINLWAIETYLEKEELKQHCAELQRLISVENAIENFIITACRNDAEIAQTYFETLEQFIGIHSLIHVPNPRQTPLLSDYGLVSGGAGYLFNDLVAAFTMNGSEAEQIKMARFQIEEDYVTEALIENENVFFIDKKEILLIKGYALAYDIEVSFLHLDKNDKKH